MKGLAVKVFVGLRCRCVVLCFLCLFAGFVGLDSWVVWWWFRGLCVWLLRLCGLPAFGGCDSLFGGCAACLLFVASVVRVFASLLCFCCLYLFVRVWLAWVLGWFARCLFC